MGILSITSQKKIEFNNGYLIDRWPSAVCRSWMNSSTFKNNTPTHPVLTNFLSGYDGTDMIAQNGMAGWSKLKDKINYKVQSEHSCIFITTMLSFTSSSTVWSHFLSSMMSCPCKAIYFNNKEKWKKKMMSAKFTQSVILTLTETWPSRDE